MFRSCACLCLVLVLVGAPTILRAQSNPDLHFNDVITVTPAGGQYVVTTSLQASDVQSFAGLTLVGIIDPDGMEPPYPDVRTFPMNQTGGIFNITIPLSYDPTGYAFEFFLVTTSTFNISGGTALFNPDNGSAYQTFLPTGISWYQQGQNGNNDGPPDDTSGGGGQTNPDLPQDFNPAEDCYDILYVDEPECTEYFATGDTVYNPNFALTATLENPLGEGGDIDILTFLASLFKTMIKFMLPILVLFTVYSGFLFVKARGNSDELKVAKQNFLYVVIGAAVVFGAWLIAKVIAGTVDQFALGVVHDIIRLL